MASLREAFPEGAPDDVKRHMLGSLHDHVMGSSEPSAGLQYTLTSRVAYNLHMLGDPASEPCKNKGDIRSALLMVTAPSSEDACSLREYGEVMGVDRGSVGEHVKQRDGAAHDAEADIYKLIRAPKDNTLMLKYEGNAVEFLHKVADPRNLGSQKNSKVNFPFLFCSLTCNSRIW